MAVVMEMAFVLQIHGVSSVCDLLCMFRIQQTEFIAPQIKRLLIEASRIARNHLAGQFVILRLHEQAHEIPLTIESSNAERGRISIVVQAVGKTPNQLIAFETGCILDVVGRGNSGTVVVIGGGNGSGFACGVESG
jgi:NAD(P)H-flavin reductase